MHQINVVSSDSHIIYPAFYAVVQVVTTAGFPHTSIWRPGLLGRGQKARGVEKVARFLITPVRHLSKIFRPGSHRIASRLKMKFDACWFTHRSRKNQQTRA